MRYVLACVLMFAFCAFTGAEQASAASLAGSWSGGGTVKLANGGVERVRCRVSYSKGTGRAYGVSATCATTAGTIHQSGTVISLGGNRYKGRLYNDQYSVSGNVTISIRGNSQSVSLSSKKGRGSLSLRRR